MTARVTMRARAGLRRLWRRDGGVTALEFALIAPIFVFFLLGSFELGRFLWLEVKVDRAAVSIGDLVTRGDSVDTDLLDSMFVAVGQIFEPFPTGALTRTIISSISLDTDGKTPKINWQRIGGGTLSEPSRIAPCGGGAKVTLPKNLTLHPSDVLILTEVFYSFTPVTGEGIMDPTIIYRNSYFRPRIASLSVITDSKTVCNPSS